MEYEIAYVCVFELDTFVLIGEVSTMDWSLTWLFRNWVGIGR